MSPGSSTDSYPAFAHIGLRENPGKKPQPNKNSIKHTTMRVLLFQIIASGISLPPQPVLTRWGMWLNAVNYYAEHYGKIMEVIDALDSTDSSAVAAVKSLPSEQLLEDILFIDSNFKIVSKSIILLESSKLQLSEALNKVDKDTGFIVTAVYCSVFTLEAYSILCTPPSHSLYRVRSKPYDSRVRLCDMYSNQELAEIHFMYGKADGNAALARRLYQERYPQRQCPDWKTFVRLHYRLYEAQFTRDGITNFHNQHVWAYENPRATVPSHHQVRFSLNMWAGIIGDRLVGSHVLVNRLTGQAYTNFLENTIPHVLEDTPLINRQHIHFLHDGAPAHFSRTARRYLDRRFPDRWIGRGGPIAWPPR
ncbi:hypothetical protein ANN_06112 [Periplaneta americana]|uniref:DUF4817 domain-containing protein n=1 Tax=Periplaneta americana TaxID=6978 RepID=A0ABQ8TEN7_PERAM|nr:hypothetical protein ANN_06112 [Periplaneta americana]